MWYLSQYTTYLPITGVQMVEQNHGSTLTYFAPTSAAAARSARLYCASNAAFGDEHDCTSDGWSERHSAAGCRRIGVFPRTTTWRAGTSSIRTVLTRPCCHWADE